MCEYDDGDDDDDDDEYLHHIKSRCFQRHALGMFAYAW